MSETAICNAALIKLGADVITARTDDLERARALNARYDAVRDAELRRHRWKFSIERADLPALSAAPLGNYARAFQLPADSLRIIQVGEYDIGLDLSDYRSAPTQAFSIEGQKILTDLSAPLHVRYIKRVTDTAFFDAAFAEAFASRLAFECCQKITGSNSMRDFAWSEYRAAVKEAALANALESAPSHPSDDSWVMARNT